MTIRLQFPIEFEACPNLNLANLNLPVGSDSANLRSFLPE